MLSARRIRALAAVTSVLLAGLTLAACTVGEPPPHPTLAPLIGARPSNRPVVDVRDSCGAASTAAASAVEFDGLPPGPDFTATAAEANGRALVLGARMYRFLDFTPADGTLDGAVVGPDATALRGAGTSKTVLELVPRSSTRAGTIPSTFPDTNPLSVLRVTGAVRDLQGFTVQGTDQGHLFNGLRVDRLDGLRARDLKVVGIPGDASSPPGETFGLNDYRTVDADYARVEIDGAGVGAAGFGVNGSRNIRICDSTSHDNPHSMGFAFWHVDGITLVDCTAERNGRAGFNFERVSGAVRMVRPVASGNRTDMSIASDQGSADYTIVDPRLTNGRWTITLPSTYYGKPNRQDRSAIHLILNGTIRDDLIRFETR